MRIVNGLDIYSSFPGYGNAQCSTKDTPQVPDDEERKDKREKNEREKLIKVEMSD